MSRDDFRIARFQQIRVNFGQLVFKYLAGGCGREAINDKNMLWYFVSNETVMQPCFHIHF